MRQILIRGSVLIITFVAVMAAGALVLLERQPLFQDRLTRSIPATASIVVKVQRQDLALWSLLAGKTSLAEATNEMENSWHLWEQDLGSRIDTVAWFDIPSPDSISAGVLFQTSHAIDEATQKRFSQKTPFITPWSWGKPLHFVILSPSLYALIPTTVPVESLHASKNIFPHALSASAVYMDMNSDLKGSMLDSIPTELSFLNEIAAVKGPLEFYIGQREHIVVAQLIIPHHGRDDIEESQPLLPFPRSYDYYLAGSIKDFAIPIYEEAPVPPTASIIQRLAQHIGFQFDVPEAQVRDILHKLNTLIGSGDKWLIAGPADVLKEAGTLFASSLHPRLRVTKLPDGSPYREFIKKEILPDSSILGGHTIQIWKQSDNDILWLVPVADQAFLTNNKQLAQEVLTISERQSGDDPLFVKQCLSSATGRTQTIKMFFQSSQQFTISSSIKNFGLYKENFDQNYEKLTLCMN